MDVNGSGYQQFNCETVSSIRNLIKIDQIFDPLRQILSLEVGLSVNTVLLYDNILKSYEAKIIDKDIGFIYLNLRRFSGNYI